MDGVLLLLYKTLSLQWGGISMLNLKLLITISGQS